MTGIVQDITERKETEFRFAHDAFHDQLTGLPNRDLFLDRVARSVTRTRRGTSKVAVLYLDVDHFAVFNNARGNEYGDTVLRAVADRLCSVMRVTDSVARFSADEFGIVCENIANAADAARRAQRVLDAVAEPFVLDGGEALITVSIGIALSEPDATSEALVRDADLAMHRAKGEGRNRFELYDLGLRQEIQQHFALETALRRAVDNGELFLEFQPIASLCDNRYVGAEALIRWKHPERGVVKPDDFIPIAERTGLIVPIGTWVLQTACQQLRLWRDAAPEGGNWRVSVNVAAAQLDAPDFPDVVEQSLQQAGLEGVALRIELTESAFIDGSVVTDALQRIRALGVRISIDDFGTKYASLSYLTRLSIDALKIDQSFIEELIGNASNQAVVSAILAIGQALGLDVTAEGVKTEAQLDELRRLGCKLAQGYYFSKPLSPKDCLAVLLGPLEPNGSRS
jgi:diguanylate cyclase (GGDEF)-like protein